MNKALKIFAKKKKTAARNAKIKSPISVSYTHLDVYKRQHSRLAFLQRAG